MKKMIIAALALSGAVLIAPSGIALAEDEPTVEGRGWLAAKGVGDVDIDMGGKIRLHVEGDVTITDHSGGDMRFAIRGGEERLAEGGIEVELDDFKGGIAIRGSDFSVEVDGKVLLAAHGEGQAWLDGQGVYRTRYGDPRPWDGMVEIAEPALESVA